jgi:serine phosphatase RsbU (regulator of sigma subunit)
LKNIFQIAMPRDIVSGDFSFIERLDKHLIIAVGDCTGHGFTGAFMTVLGTNILKTLTTRKILISPSEMLIELDKQIDQSLNKDNSDDDSILRDGMEIGICIFNLEDQTMQFAGAGLSLYYTKDDELLDLQGDFKQIGNFDIDNFQYKNQSMPYQKNMNFYMFSDGFQDQFGGPFKKKFSKKRIKQVLTDMQTVELTQQKTTIEREFLDWKGELKQTDDFIFLGFNLNS